MQGKTQRSEPPRLKADIFWPVAIILWSAFVYIVFFVNFIRNFLSTRGG